MKKKEEIRNDFDESDASNYQKSIKFPMWLLFLLLKYWAAAAAVFFILIGGLSIGIDFSTEDTGDLATVIANDIKIVVLLGLFICLFMNYIVRPIVRMMNNRQTNTFRYNMVNVKGLKSFFISLGYNMLMSVILFFITVYFLSPNGLVLDLFGTAQNVGIEPFTYGLCYIVVDFVFLFFKDLIVDCYSRYKYKKQMSAEV